MEKRDHMTEQEKKEFRALCEKLSAQMKIINEHKETYSPLAVSA